MNEVRLGAGRTHYGRVAISRILWRIRQPMLHIQPGLGASKYARLSHGRPLCQRPIRTEITDDYVGRPAVGSRFGKRGTPATRAELFCGSCFPPITRPGTVTAQPPSPHLTGGTVLATSLFNRERTQEPMAHNYFVLVIGLNFTMKRPVLVQSSTCSPN
jgi:hypothetical protein